jgi:hypothetical protein
VKGGGGGGGVNIVIYLDTFPVRVLYIFWDN